MSRAQAVPPGQSLTRPQSEHEGDFAKREPEVHSALSAVLQALRADLVPPELQEELFRRMNAAVQRSIISEVSGLDASILVTFKQQLHLVDAILRRTFNSDGTLKLNTDAEGNIDVSAMDPKDVLNLSLKVSQMMVKELPKVYNMDRIQKMETALYEVMSKHLTREQQQAFLEELDGRRRT